MAVAKRRTREEKEKAKLKLVATKFSFSASSTTSNPSQSSVVDSEVVAIKKDLLKTLTVIVLALASEFIVYLIVHGRG